MFSLIVLNWRFWVLVNEYYFELELKNCFGFFLLIRDGDKWFFISLFVLGFFFFLNEKYSMWYFLKNKGNSFV